MPLPSSISDLSQVAGSNSPAGSESPSLIDDYLRTYASYIAILRDNPGRLLNIQVFTASGTYTPTTGTTSIVVHVVGGGGGGGGAAATGAGQVSAGAGGGGGGYTRKRLGYGSGTTAVTVGAGGGGVSAGNGTAGGTSSFGAVCQATGGGGGSGTIGAVTVTNAVNYGIGVGGVGSSGDVNAVGGIGLYAYIAVTSNSGPGGSSFFGSGAPYVGPTSPGTTAVTVGSGGSGSCVGPNSTAGNGGSGKSGIVIVEEYS
jgi:hypothetical protein